MEKRIEDLEKRVKELESLKKENLSIFGRSYQQVGNSNSDFLIKTKGQVKVQWGSKFIDIIKDGKINVDSKFIFKVSNLSDIGVKDGLYVVGDNSIYLKIGDLEPINLVGEIGNTFVSFVEGQETTSNAKHNALVNIGFIYKTLNEINETSLQNGIIYVESEQKLYIIQDGILSEFKVQNPFTEQFIIQKNDDSKGSLIIRGTGIENSILFDSFELYSEANNCILNSNKSILFKIGNSNKIVVDNSSTIFNSDLITDLIKSKSATSDSGFRLYCINGESVLEVDRIIERDSASKSIQLFPEYLLLDNQIIKEVKQNEDTFDITLYQESTYQKGDILYIYEQKEQKIDPNTGIEREDSIIVYNKYELIVDNVQDNILTVKGNIDSEDNFTGKFIFLAKTVDNRLPIRIKDNNIDIVEYREIIDNKREEIIKTRIGNLSEIPNLDRFGIYSNQAIFDNVKYTKDYELLEDDNSTKLASTEWVNKKLKNLDKVNPGYYWAIELKDNKPVDPIYIGTTEQDFQVSSEKPFLLYTNDGESWSIIRKYIPPQSNRIYILSTNISNNTDSSTGTVTRWPSGFLCYQKNGESFTINYGKSNYISVKSTVNQLENIPQLSTLLADVEAGSIPVKSGYFYLWSIEVGLDKSNPSNWVVESSGSINVSITIKDTCDWGNQTTIPGYTLWEVDDNDIIIGEPSSSNFKNGEGTQENWSDSTWRRSFIRAILGETLTNNISNYSSETGWRFNYSGILKSTGYSGSYWSSRIGKLQEPTSDDKDNINSIPTATIGDVCGQVFGKDCIIYFQFTNVRIGKELPYRYALGGYKIGDKLSSDGIKLFATSYDKCYYKIISDFTTVTDF